MKLFLILSFFLLDDIVVLIYVQRKLDVRVGFSSAQKAHSLHLRRVRKHINRRHFL